MHLRDEIDRTLTEQELEFLDSVGHLPQDELTAQYDDASEKFKGKTNHDLIYSLKNTYKIPSNQKLEQAFKASAVIYEYRQRGLDKAAQAGQHHPGKDHKSKQWLHEATQNVKQQGGSAKLATPSPAPAPAAADALLVSVRALGNGKRSRGSKQTEAANKSTSTTRIASAATPKPPLPVIQGGPRQQNGRSNSDEGPSQTESLEIEDIDHGVSAFQRFAYKGETSKTTGQSGARPAVANPTPSGVPRSHPLANASLSGAPGTVNQGAFYGAAPQQQPRTTAGQGRLGFSDAATRTTLAQPRPPPPFLPATATHNQPPPGMTSQQGRQQQQQWEQRQPQRQQQQQQRPPPQKQQQRQPSQRQQQKRAREEDQEGNQDQPIVLSSDDDEEEEKDNQGPGKEGQQGTRAQAPARPQGPEAGGTRHSERLAQASLAAAEGGIAHILRGCVMRYPPESSRSAVTVGPSDLERLEDEEFLNDTVIDFYMRYIEHHLSPGMRERCYFFNSFFYKKLTEHTPANARRKSAAARATPPASAPAPRGGAARPQEPEHLELLGSSPAAMMAPHEVQAALRAEGDAGGGAKALEQALDHAASGDQELAARAAKEPGAGTAGSKGRAQSQSQPRQSQPDRKELKARTDHARVKNWTKYVDLFSKDFIFVPIHEALHWSLAIICHPGNWHGRRGHGTACILHLDSMADGGLHSSQQVFGKLQGYLRQEWLRKADEESDNTARRYALEHPDEQPSFAPAKCPGIPIKGVPQQDNHCDCGLFVLAYTQFFCHGDLPRMDHKLIPESVKGSKPNTRQGKGKQGQERNRDEETLLPDQPDFLTRSWFKPENTSALRYHLRWLIHKEMLDQMVPQGRESSVPLAAQGTTPPPASAQPPSRRFTEEQQQQRTYLMQLIQEYSVRQDNKKLGTFYMPPAEWFQWTQAQALKRMQGTQAQTKPAFLIPRLKQGPVQDPVADEDVTALEDLPDRAQGREGQAGQQAQHPGAEQQTPSPAAQDVQPEQSGGATAAGAQGSRGRGTAAPSAGEPAAALQEQDEEDIPTQKRRRSTLSAVRRGSCEGGLGSDGEEEQEPGVEARARKQRKSTPHRRAERPAASIHFDQSCSQPIDLAQSSGDEGSGSGHKAGRKAGAPAAQPHSPPPRLQLPASIQGPPAQQSPGATGQQEQEQVGGEGEGLEIDDDHKQPDEEAPVAPPSSSAKRRKKDKKQRHTADGSGKGPPLPEVSHPPAPTPMAAGSDPAAAALDILEGGLDFVHAFKPPRRPACSSLPEPDYNEAPQDVQPGGHNGSHINSLEPDDDPDSYAQDDCQGGSDGGGCEGEDPESLPVQVPCPAARLAASCDLLLLPPTSSRQQARQQQQGHQQQYPSHSSANDGPYGFPVPPGWISQEQPRLQSSSARQALPQQSYKQPQQEPSRHGQQHSSHSRVHPASQHSQRRGGSASTSPAAAGTFALPSHINPAQHTRFESSDEQEEEEEEEGAHNKQHARRELRGGGAAAAPAPQHPAALTIPSAGHQTLQGRNEHGEAHKVMEGHAALPAARDADMSPQQQSGQLKLTQEEPPCHEYTSEELVASSELQHSYDCEKGDGEGEAGRASTGHDLSPVSPSPAGLQPPLSSTGAGTPHGGLAHEQPPTQAGHPPGTNGMWENLQPTSHAKHQQSLLHAHTSRHHQGMPIAVAQPAAQGPAAALQGHASTPAAPAAQMEESWWEESDLEGDEGDRQQEPADNQAARLPDPHGPPSGARTPAPTPARTQAGAPSSPASAGCTPGALASSPAAAAPPLAQQQVKETSSARREVVDLAGDEEEEQEEEEDDVQVIEPVNHPGAKPGTGDRGPKHGSKNGKAQAAKKDSGRGSKGGKQDKTPAGGLTQATLSSWARKGNG